VDSKETIGLGWLGRGNSRVSSIRLSLFFAARSRLTCPVASSYSIMHFFFLCSLARSARKVEAPFSHTGRSGLKAEDRGKRTRERKFESEESKKEKSGSFCSKSGILTWSIELQDTVGRGLTKIPCRRLLVRCLLG